MQPLTWNMVIISSTRVLDDERVRLARRLVDVGAFGRDPVVLEVVPLALEHEAVHRLRMAVARQHAGFPHAQEVLPVAARGGEAERAEPDVLRLRHPEPLVRGSTSGMTSSGGECFGCGWR